jgi:hypothetical protein
VDRPRCFANCGGSEALLHMRSDWQLSNEAMQRIVRELALEASRLEI